MLDLVSATIHNVQWVEGIEVDMVMIVTHFGDIVCISSMIELVSPTVAVRLLHRLDLPLTGSEAAGAIGCYIYVTGCGDG